MPVSRRGFLGYAAAGSMAGFIGGLRRALALPPNSGVPQETVLADPGPSCLLRESMAGYGSALSSANVSFRRASLQRLPHARKIILPASVIADQSKLILVKSRVEGGATVLLESPAGHDFSIRVKPSYFRPPVGSQRYGQEFAVYRLRLAD